MMRGLCLTTLLGALAGLVGGAAADGMVTSTRIKVQLFAAPGYLSEVSIDAHNDVCVSLDNNLIDGMVQSILVGGHDVATVLQRNDFWHCQFYDNYDCKGDTDAYLAIPDGVNSLGSHGWGTRIHGIRCHNAEFGND